MSAKEKWFGVGIIIAVFGVAGLLVGAVLAFASLFGGK